MDKEQLNIWLKFGNEQEREFVKVFYGYRAEILEKYSKNGELDVAVESPGIQKVFTIYGEKIFPLLELILDNCALQKTKIRIKDVWNTTIATYNIAIEQSWKFNKKYKENEKE